MKLHSKDHTLSDSIYVNCPEKVNLQGQQVSDWWPGAGVRIGSDCKWVLAVIWGDRNVLKLDCSDGFQMLQIS